MMKKILAIILSLILILALSAGALAAEEEEETEAGTVTHEAVTVTKEYTVSGGDGETIPEETLSFTVEPDENNPDDVDITVNPIDTADGLNITIGFGNYSKMGVYKYIVTENTGSTLGVTYDETPIIVIVTVVNEKAGQGTENELKAYVGAFEYNGEDEEYGDKVGGDPGGEGSAEFAAAFTNQFAMGKLTVSKKVTGNLADNTKAFDIVVTFTGGAKAANAITYTVAGGQAQTLSFDEDGEAEATISLKHDQSAEFTNIPAGIEYTVVEAEKHTTGTLNSEEGYTATYANSDDEEETTTGCGSIAAEDDDTVEITNEKKTEIQTGVILDYLPYVLIVLVVVAAIVAMLLRRRRSAED